MSDTQQNQAGSGVARHVRALRDCNQRGGRMLTLLDLLRAGTVDLPLAAYLAAVIRAGGSLLVGANPGGAGKTTVMVALLNFLPDETQIQPIEGPVVLRRGLRDEAYGERCYLAHEIGDGYYYAYIWGEQARDFFELGGRGHIIASNLHADTLEETRTQLCAENGVDPEHLAAVELKLYLRMARGAAWRTRRWLSHVYESSAAVTDRLIWSGDRPGDFTRRAESAIVSPDEEGRYADLLTRLKAKGAGTLDEVRRAVVDSPR
jgi:hypothetical protein